VLLNRNEHYWYRFFCFLKLSLPSTLLLPPGPAAVPMSLEKRVKLFLVVRCFVRDVGVKSVAILE